MIAPFFQPQKKRQSITVIGSAGGTLFRIWQELFGNRFEFQFEGAEIDPVVARLSAQFFGVNYPNLKVKTIDGRRYLRHSPNRFDVVVLDAYNNLYIPPHLTSLEFFQLVESKLTTNGVMMANIHSWLNTVGVIGRIIRTIAEVFEKVWIVTISSTNFMIIGTNGASDLFAAINNLPPALNDLAKQIERRSHQMTDLPKVELITDDRPLSAILFDTVAIARWLNEQ